MNRLIKLVLQRRRQLAGFADLLHHPIAVAILLDTLDIGTTCSVLGTTATQVGCSRSCTHSANEISICAVHSREAHSHDELPYGVSCSNVVELRHVRLDQDRAATLKTSRSAVLRGAVAGAEA